MSHRRKILLTLGIAFGIGAIIVLPILWLSVISCLVSLICVVESLLSEN
jgi:hypothetical protein